MKGFAEFIREKTYLQNVTPATVYWYEQSFKSLGIPEPTAEDITEWVVRCRQAGVSATSVNTYARAINCYLNWRGSTVRVPKLKTPQKIPSTFSVEDIKKIAKWKPKKRCERRVQAFMLTLADTGARCNEILSLKWVDVDFDNLLLTVHGKGGRDRKIPFSFELRRVLYPQRGNGLVFGTRTGCKLSHRNTLRDVKLALKKLGIEPPERTIHALRHTFAINYLRRGGSVFHLQKVLGHSTLDMTRRYANLNTEDLSAVHQQVSLLS